MKTGANRVWMDPEKIEDIETVITRKEIRKLIKDGVIKPHPIKGVSRARARILHQKKKMGKRRGFGSREGANYARLPRKKRWIQKIRAIRKKLRELVETKAITITTRRKLYEMAKGGVFENVPQLLRYIQSAGLYRRKAK